MELILLEEVKDHLPAGFDPYQIYSIVVSHQEVGRLTLREGNDAQRYYDGHIGYTIDEQFRGHSYAYQACLLLKDMIERDHLLISCDPQNIASLRTIEKLGCCFLETVTIPAKYKKFFAKDEKIKNIYLWKLQEEEK